MKQQLTDEQFKLLQSLGFPYGNTIGELIQFLLNKYPDDLKMMKFPSAWEVGTSSRQNWRMNVHFRADELMDALYEFVETVLLNRV